MKKIALLGSGYGRGIFSKIKKIMIMFAYNFVQ